MNSVDGRRSFGFVDGGWSFSFGDERRSFGFFDEGRSFVFIGRFGRRIEDESSDFRIFNELLLMRVTCMTLQAAPRHHSTIPA